MKNCAFLFPGQGSQVAGMLSALPEHPAIAMTLTESADFFGSEFATMDSEHRLRSENRCVQLCLYIAGVASARMLIAEGMIPFAVAGLSVGAFAAAVIGGTLEFAEGLQMVARRAELMTGLYPSGYGMSAIVGLSEVKVRQIVANVNAQEPDVYISNINSPLQITVSGVCSGLQLVEESALKSGAEKAQRLNVAIPSHCPLYASVAEKLRTEFNGITIQNPTVSYIGNIKARRLRDGESIIDDLSNNIAYGVRWYDSVTVLVELGAEVFLEMYPGEVLTKLLIADFPAKRALALSKAPLSYVKRILGIPV